MKETLKFVRSCNFLLLVGLSGLFIFSICSAFLFVNINTASAQTCGWVETDRTLTEDPACDGFIGSGPPQPPPASSCTIADNGDFATWSGCKNISMLDVTYQCQCSGFPDLISANTGPAANASFTTAQSIPFTGTVTNQSTAAVTQGGWAGLEIDFDRNGGALTDGSTGYDDYLDLPQQGSFSANQIKTLSWTTSAGFFPAGNHRYRWNVDSVNELTESNETNNRHAWVNFVVTTSAICPSPGWSEPTDSSYDGMNGSATNWCNNFSGGQCTSGAGGNSPSSNGGVKLCCFVELPDAAIGYVRTCQGSTTYTYTFNLDGGAPFYASVTEVAGSAVASPGTPTKSGYTFNGWSPSLPTTMPVGGGNSTAQWVLTAAVPTVIIPTHANVAQTSATLGATVFSAGSSALTARGTCWGTSINPVTNCIAEGGTAVSVFTHARSGFSPGITYYYRGYATNAVGTGYSADSSFETLANVPTGLIVTPLACSTGQNFLDWADAAGADNYSIYSSTGVWIGNSIGSNYTHTGSLSTLYSYYVRANNTTGAQSGNSTIASATTAGVCIVGNPDCRLQQIDTCIVPSVQFGQTSVGSCIVNYSGTCSYQCGAGGEWILPGTNLCTVVVPPVSPPTLTATPPIVNQGSATTLTWNLNGQTDCTLSGGGITPFIVAAGGSYTATVNANTTYTLACASGGSDTATVEIIPSGFET